MTDLNKSPALWAIYRACLAIEACGASDTLTEVSARCNEALRITEQEIGRLRQFDRLARLAKDAGHGDPYRRNPEPILHDLASLAPEEGATT